MKRLFSHKPKALTIQDLAVTVQHPSSYSSSADYFTQPQWSAGSSNTASSSSLSPLTPAPLTSPISPVILASAGPHFGGLDRCLDVAFDGQYEEYERRASDGVVNGKASIALPGRARGRSVSFVDERRPLRSQKSKSRPRGPSQQGAEEQIRNKITYLIASASEDMALVMDICQSASHTESTAKEAVRLLRQEFKYGDAMGQLAATKLWAANAPPLIKQFHSRINIKKFLSTLETLLTSPHTSPVVRDRLLEVLGAAAYASGQYERGGFRGLWIKVKPSDKPEKGVPLQSEDQVFPLVPGPYLELVLACTRLSDA